MLRHVDNKHPIVASCWFSLSSHFAHDARSQEPKGMAVLYKRILRAGMSFVKVGWMTLYLGGKWLPVIFIFLEPVRWNLIVVISPPCCWVLMGFAKIDVTYTILHFWGRIKFWPLSTIFSWLLDKIQYSRFTHTHTHTKYWVIVTFVKIGAVKVMLYSGSIWISVLPTFFARYRWNFQP